MAAEEANGCPGEEDLARLVGSWKPEDHSELFAHLDICLDCRQVVGVLARRSATMPSLDDASAPLPTVEPGAIVDRYVVLHKAGAGGMGVVFVAYDPTLDRKVAIKFVRSRARADARVAEAERVAGEARALARASHPNVVAVYDGGNHGDLVYLVMEYVDGVTLRRWLAESRRSNASIAGVLRQAGEGLQAIHQARLVHRDFKPDNVMVGHDGRVRVTDFGLALEEDLTAKPGLAEIAGTLRYMAPEQLRGERAGSSSDQFAFAVTAYEAFSGVHPFSGTSRHECLEAVRDGARVRGPRSRTVPRSISSALLRALSFDPEDRHADMVGLLHALAPPLPRRPLAAAVSVVLLTCVVALGIRQRHSARAGTCRGAQAKLAGAWDETNRQQILQAFGRLTRVPFAETTGRTAVRTLDTYASGWAAAYTRACEATRFEGVQSDAMLDRQMACLDDRRKELAALGRVLRAPDAAIAQHAVEGVDRLSDVKSCLDVRALMHRDPASLSPSNRALEGEVADLKGRVDAGDFAGIQRGLDDALDRSKKAGNRYAEARAQALLAETKRSAGDLPATEASLLESVFASEAAGDDEESATAWTRLAAIAGLEQAHTQEAERYARHAEALLTRLESPVLHASLLEARGRGALRTGDYDSAVTHFRQALELLASSGKSESRFAANSQDGLGYALASTGKAAEGRRELESALDVRERLLGSSHPDVAANLFDLAKVDLDEGRYSDAELRLARALEVFRSQGKKETPTIANVINSLGAAEEANGHPEEAKRQFVEALGMFRQFLGDHPATAVTASNIADIDVGAGRFEDARREFVDALAILDRSGAVDRDTHARLLTGIGRSEVGLGHLMLAKQSLTAALDIYTSGTFAPGDRGTAELAMAHLLAQSGNRGDALVFAKKARASYTGQAAYSKELGDADALLDETVALAAARDAKTGATR